MPLSALIAVLLVFAIIGGLGWLCLEYRSRARQLEGLHRTFQEQRAAALDLINRIGVSINADLDLERSLEIITNYIVDATDAEAGAIFLFEDDGRRTLRARAVSGLFPPMHATNEYILTKRKYLTEHVKRERIQLGEGIVGFVAQTGEAVLIGDALSDPRVPKVATDFLQISSTIVAPLRMRQRVAGVFAVVNKKGDRVFDKRDLRLLQQLSDHAALVVDMVRLYEQRAEQQRLEQELQVAHEFQKMLLPTEAPEVPGLDIAAFSQPALEVGGDYYDFFWVDERHLGIAIVDVSGKGIPGALVMAVVRSTLRAEALNDLSPKEVLRRVNRRIVADTKENVFVTITYGIVDVRTMRLRFVRAGHEPLIVWNAEDPNPRLITPKGVALGLAGDEVFAMTEETEISLNSGDTALLYTDGVVEAMNPRGEEFGSERLFERLQKEQRESAREEIDAVLEGIHDFTAGIPQHDDITLVAIKVREVHAQTQDAGAAALQTVSSADETRQDDAERAQSGR